MDLKLETYTYWKNFAQRLDKFCNLFFTQRREILLIFIYSVISKLVEMNNDFTYLFTNNYAARYNTTKNNAVLSNSSSYENATLVFRELVELIGVEWRVKVRWTEVKDRRTDGGVHDGRGVRLEILVSSRQTKLSTRPPRLFYFRLKRRREMKQACSVK